MKQVNNLMCFSRFCTKAERRKGNSNLKKHQLYSPCLKWNKNWEYVPRYKRIRYNFNSTKKRFLPRCEIACVLGNCLGTKFSNMTWKLSKPINPGRNLSTLWISTAYLPAIQYLNCTVCNIFAEIARQNLLNYITFCLEFMSLQAWF